MKLHDISRPIRVGMPVWPGDTPFEFRFGMTRAAGASVNVGRVVASIHTGTHVDAPYHFDDAGATIEAIPPEVYIGPARVVDVRGLDVIGIADLDGIDFSGVPRLLLKTGGWPDPMRFPGSIPVIADDVPAYLKGQGVVLLGLDVPSVDRIDSKDLPIHHALGAAGVLILESLDLADVPPGVYELIAVPLRLAGADGSPVRAILREVRSV